MRQRISRRTVVGLNDYKDDNDDDQMVVIVSCLVTCDIELNHQSEEFEIRKGLRCVVYVAVLWQPSVHSHRAGTWYSFLDRLPRITRMCF